MANFKQRFKRDKKFRILVSLIILFIVSIMVSNSPDKKTFKTFEECHQYNSVDLRDIFLNVFTGGWVWVWPEDGSRHFAGVDTALQEATCIDNSCFVAKYPVEGIVDPKVCVPYVPNGWAIQEDYATQGCQDHTAGSDYGLFGWVLCKNVPPDQQCNAAEANIANVLPGMDGISCKTRYYIVLFGGGMMLFMMIGVIL